MEQEPTGHTPSPSDRAEAAVIVKGLTSPSEGCIITASDSSVLEILTVPRTDRTIQEICSGHSHGRLSNGRQTHI